MSNGPKIAAISLVVILAAAGLYYAFVAPASPTPARTGAGSSEPAAAAPASANGLGATGLGSQTPTTIPSVGAAPSAATSTPAIGALTGTPTPTNGLGANGLGPRGEQPGFAPGSLGAAGTGKGDLPSTARPSIGGAADGTRNGLPAGGLTARPIGPTQPPVSTPPSADPLTSPSNPSGPSIGGPRPLNPERPSIPASGSTAPAGEQFHVVASGDTMSGIAKRYLGKESAWNAIAKANPNVDPTAMKVGTRIRIPAGDAAASSATGSSASAPSGTTTASASAAVHTVAAGDTLSSIARKHYGDGKHWERIYEANKSAIGSDPARLKVGQRLTLPKIDGVATR